jgi:hypothetical protein
LNFDFFQNTFKQKIRFMILQTNNAPSIEQVINKMRDDVLRSQSTASTTSILSFDNLVEQMKIFVRQINDKDVEIMRLHELCKKNNVDYTVKIETPQKSTPAAKVTPTTKSR